MFVKVSARCTVKPLAPLVASFITRILVPASAVVVAAVGLKFAPPLIVNSVPRSRCTAVVSSPLKSKPAVVNSVFTVPTFVSV